MTQSMTEYSHQDYDSSLDPSKASSQKIRSKRRFSGLPQEKNRREKDERIEEREKDCGQRRGGNSVSKNVQEKSVSRKESREREREREM